MKLVGVWRRVLQDGIDGVFSHDHCTIHCSSLRVHCSALGVVHICTSMGAEDMLGVHDSLAWDLSPGFSPLGEIKGVYVRNDGGGGVRRALGIL